MHLESSLHFFSLASGLACRNLGHLPDGQSATLLNRVGCMKHVAGLQMSGLLLYRLLLDFDVVCVFSGGFFIWVAMFMFLGGSFLGGGFDWWFSGFSDI